jgi:hypothetical protein
VTTTTTIQTETDTNVVTPPVTTVTQTITKRTVTVYYYRQLSDDSLKRHIQTLTKTSISVTMTTPSCITCYCTAVQDVSGGIDPSKREDLLPRSPNANCVAMPGGDLQPTMTVTTTVLTSATTITQTETDGVLTATTTTITTTPNTVYKNGNSVIEILY